MPYQYPLERLTKALVLAGWSGISDPPHKFRAGWLYQAHAAAWKHADGGHNEAVAAVSADLRKHLHLPRALGVNVCACLIVDYVVLGGDRTRAFLRPIEDQVRNQIGTTTAALALQAVIAKRRSRLPKPDFKS